MNSAIADRIAVPRVRDQVDVTSEDSFPASDPPSWTPIVGTGPPCRAGSRVGADPAAVETGTRGRAELGQPFDPAESPAMNHERSSIQMPFRLVWKRPAEAAQWDASWCWVPLAGGDAGPEEVAPGRSEPVAASARTVGGPGQ
jgi:hypothetical protein